MNEKIKRKNRGSRLISLLLALILCACSAAVLTACQDENEGKESGTPAATPAETPEDDKEEIILPEFDFLNEDLTKYVKLGQYKGFELEVAEKTEITDELLWEQLKSDLIYSGIVDKITDRAVTEDDTVSIEFKGFMDGEPLENGSGSQDNFTIYDGGGFIPGFAEGLIGAMPGVEVTVELNFPDEYHQEDLQGMPVTFLVTVKHIYEAKELTDEIAVELTGDKDMTRDSLIEKYRELMEERAESLFESSKLTATWDKIFESIEVIELPKDLIDGYFNVDMKYYETYAQYYGVTLEQMLEYVGLTEETLYENAKNNILTDMTVYSIIKAEGISVSEDEYKEKLAEFAEQNNCDEEDVLKEYTKEDLMSMFLYTKAYETAASWQSFTYTESTEEA